MTQAIDLRGYREIDADWLSRVLAANDVDARVASFEVEQVGTGQLGETRRFHLRYQGHPSPNAPATLVGKFPSDTENARESGRSMGFYRSEVMFYREVAPRARINAPYAYAAEIDELGDFTLIFADAAPAQPGDQMRGMTLDQARMALDEAALLHAAFWNDTELMNQDWCYVPEGAQGFYNTQMMEESWDYFKKAYDGALTAEEFDLCDLYVRHHAHWNRPRDFPKCFSHNDFRPDNMLFQPGERITVVDWQTSNFLGTGMDAAYLLGGALDRQTLRENQQALLQGYHQTLLDNGVTDYSFEHLLADYRHYSFAVIAVAVIATVIVKRTERGDQMLLHMIRGGAHQALDSGAVDELRP